MFNDEYLKDLNKWINQCFKSPEKNTDLLNNLLSEEVPELIEFIKKVKRNLTPLSDSTGDYCRGYNDAINDLRRILQIE